MDGKNSFLNTISTFCEMLKELGKEHSNVLSVEKAAFPGGKKTLPKLKNEEMPQHKGLKMDGKNTFLNIISILGEILKELGKEHLDELSVEETAGEKKTLFPGGKKTLPELDNKEMAQHKDTRLEIAHHAGYVIQDSKGPLKHNELLKICLNDIFDEKSTNILTFVRKYPDDICGIKLQLSQILRNVQTRMEYKKKKIELDGKVIAAIIKLYQTIEKEHKEMQSNEEQSTSKQYSNARISELNFHEISKSNNQDLQKKEDAVKKYRRALHPISVPETGKRKRKIEEMSSSKNSCEEINKKMCITPKVNKNFKLISHENVTESRSNTQSRKGTKLESRSKFEFYQLKRFQSSLENRNKGSISVAHAEQRREFVSKSQLAAPISVVDSEYRRRHTSSNQNTDPELVVDTEYRSRPRLSSQDTDLMSIASSKTSSIRDIEMMSVSSLGSSSIPDTELMSIASSETSSIPDIELMSVSSLES